MNFAFYPVKADIGSILLRFLGFFLIRFQKMVNFSTFRWGRIHKIVRIGIPSIHGGCYTEDRELF